MAMAMTDSGKFTALLAASACLAVFSVAYSTALEPFFSGRAEMSRRREQYERSVTEKGLSLHPGMYWNKKE